jgi:hypothetical protein
MIELESIVTNQDVSFIPFHWAHPHAMRLREWDAALFTEIPNFNEYLKLYAQNGYGVTALVRGTMACCFGVNMLWPGVAEAWLITGYQVDSNPISLSRGAMRYFDYIAIKLILHRLQITVDTRNEVALRWANLLKFKREGVLEKYGPAKSDFVMMSRIF